MTPNLQSLLMVEASAMTPIVSLVSRSGFKKEKPKITSLQREKHSIKASFTYFWLNNPFLLPIFSQNLHI